MHKKTDHQRARASVDRHFAVKTMGDHYLGDEFFSSKWTGSLEWDVSGALCRAYLDAYCRGLRAGRRLRK